MSGKTVAITENLLTNTSISDGSPEISWFTPPGIGHTGFGVAAIQLIQAIQDRKIRVSFATDNPLVHVSFVQPEWYQLRDNQYTVGYTPWESTEIPKQWLSYMSRCEEIWTTSNFCKEVFERSGVTPPITVVPHGINPDIWTIKEREVGEKFRFLHVGGDTDRKGGQLVAKAFLRLFDGKQDVELVMKSHGPNMARWRKGDWYGGNIGNHPQVTCIEETFEGSGPMADLYHSCHCMVYPTNGEGFGFIPFDAIATGMPTIVTNLTGCEDFAGLSMPLRATWGPGKGIHTGEWAVPDEEHLEELMLSAYEDFYNHKKKALQSAKIIHTTQTWDHIADQVLNILGDKVEKIAQ